MTRKNDFKLTALVMVLSFSVLQAQGLGQALNTFESDSTQVAQSIIKIVGGVFGAICLVGLVFTFATGQQGEDKRSKLIGFGVGMIVFAALFFLAKTLAQLIQ